MSELAFAITIVGLAWAFVYLARGTRHCRCHVYERVLDDCWAAVRAGLEPDAYREHKWPLAKAIEHRITEERGRFCDALCVCCAQDYPVEEHGGHWYHRVPPDFEPTLVRNERCTAEAIRRVGMRAGSAATESDKPEG